MLSSSVLAKIADPKAIYAGAVDRVECLYSVNARAKDRMADVETVGFHVEEHGSGGGRVRLARRMDLDSHGRAGRAKLVCRGAGGSRLACGSRGQESRGRTDGQENIRSYHEQEPQSTTPASRSLPEAHSGVIVTQIRGNLKQSGERLSALSREAALGLYVALEVGLAFLAVFHEAGDLIFETALPGYRVM